MKKSVKKSVSVLLTVLIILGMITALPFTVSAVEAEASVGASSGTTGDCTWTLDDEGTLTISGNGAMGSYSLDSDSPWGKSIKSVVIENGVTSIGAWSFYYCTGLKNVIIPNSVTRIGKNAFCNCTGLTSVYINDIAAWCEISFSTSSNPLSYARDLYINNKLVTDLIIPDSVTSIGAYTFSGCAGLTSVKIGNGVKSIGGDAFFFCTGLTRITIPDSVTSISERAFYGCTSLTSVTIPDSVTSIGEYAFDSCNNLTIYGYEGSYAQSYAEKNSIPFELFSGTVVVSRGTTGDCAWTLDDEGTLTISGNGAMEDYRDGGLPPWAYGIKCIVIESGVTSIGNYAFYFCTSLTSITIPDSVMSIGDYAFRSCTSLTSVIIPESLTEIGYEAFYCCSRLENITLPESLTKIARRAFHETKWYDNQPDGIVYAGKVAYCYKGTRFANTSLIIQDGTKGIVASAFEGFSGLTSITIPDSVTSIGGYAFKKCSGLTSVIIPDSVTSIGYEAFKDCTGLTSVTIPNSVTSIGDWAFDNCSADLIIYCEPGSFAASFFYRTNVTGDCVWTLDDGVLTINGNGAMKDYSYNSSLLWGTDIKSVIIENGVTSIGSYAFYGCTGLTSVIIPDSVTNIGEGAFSGCTGLTSIIIPDSVTSIGWNAFEDCTGLTSVTIGNGVTSIGERAFANCSGLTSVTIPGSVINFGSSAFANCTGLTSVTIGNGVTSIGERAFANCSGLTSVTIPDSLTSIGYNAFASCDALTDVYYGGSAADWQKVHIDYWDYSLKYVTIHYAKATPVTSVVIRTEVTITAGTKYTLIATILPSNATDKSVIWSSSNSSVATVSSSGVVTAKAAGTCTITAKSNNGKTATCKVTVTQPVTGIKLNTTAVTITKGNKYTLKATVYPSDATNKSVTWSSSNSSVASVSASGVVTAKSAGSCTITAKTNNGITATCTVTVKNPTVAVTGIKLNTTSVTMTAGTKYTLKATITPSNATNKNLSWSSSNPAVAGMSAGGVINAKAAGTCTITVKSSNGKTATCKVTVKKKTVAVTSVKLNTTKLTITAGKKYTLKATINPSNATNKTLTWSSSNPKVAGMSAGGVVNAKKKGTCTITVKSSNGKTAKCQVTVK